MEISAEAIEKLESFARTRSLRYQEIVPGLGGSGRDRSYLNPMLFEGSEDGFKFLDIGSNLGYFCLEAAARNAGRVVGVDPDSSNIELASEIADIVGPTVSNVSYVQGQFEDLELEDRSFDVVACLNVLHHMYDPIAALHKMMAVASHKVVLEFAVPNLGDVASGAISPVGWLARRQAAVLLGRSRFFSNGMRTFMFSREAIRILFNEHTALFEPVRFVKSPFKGRWIAEAVRRQIGHLVLVSGPTSVGKSTFLEALKERPELRSRIGIDPDSPLVFCNANLLDLPKGRIDTLVVHYDMLRPYLSSIKSYDRDIPLQITAAADRVSAVSLYADVDVLQERLKKHELSRWFVSKRHKTIHEDYKSASFLVNWYEDWLAFCAKQQSVRDSYLIRTDLTDDYVVENLERANLPWKS
jgi:2-polyprenyl-3-methyl-5-hydroxy-6-metoxy-1,4-benzoquinol methylase